MLSRLVFLGVIAALSGSVPARAAYTIASTNPLGFDVFLENTMGDSVSLTLTNTGGVIRSFTNFVANGAVYGGRVDRNDAVVSTSVAAPSPNGCTAAVPLATGGTCTFTLTFNTADATPDNGDYGLWFVQVQVNALQGGTNLQTASQIPGTGLAPVFVVDPSFAVTISETDEDSLFERELAAGLAALPEPPVIPVLLVACAALLMATRHRRSGGWKSGSSRGL
jgi:hypothetical protein